MLQSTEKFGEIHLAEKKKSFINTVIVYTVIFFLVFLIVNHFLFKVTQYVENNIPSITPNSHIVVNLLTYHTKSIDRWDIAYLENKDNSNEFLFRRVLGLPGETIFLKNGDVYVENILQQKNSDNQKKLWVPGFDLKEHVTKNPTNPMELFSVFQSEFWQLTPQGNLVSHPGGEGKVVFQMENIGEKNTRDICVSFDISFTKDMGKFYLMTHYYDKQLLLYLPSASNHKNPHIQEEMKIIKSLKGVQFKPGVFYHIDYCIYDLKLEVFINGVRVARHNWGKEPINEKRLGPTTLTLGVINSELTINNFEVKRDITFENIGRYGIDSEMPFKIPADQYFVATENPDTSPTDSRGNGSVGLEYIKGKVVLSFYPNFMKWIY